MTVSIIITISVLFITVVIIFNVIFLFCYLCCRWYVDIYVQMQLRLAKFACPITAALGTTKRNCLTLLQTTRTERSTGKGTAHTQADTK